MEGNREGTTETTQQVRERAVLHIDMNAFYCSCHASAEPEKYAGRPTAVAGSPETRHGVVVTASYEARRLGVRATMTVAQALRQAPQLILIHPDFTLYRAYSRNVFEVVRSFTPVVEVFSIDECWADVTGSWQFGTPEEIAQKIQNRIRDELGLPCSIGVSTNKFLAKMASDMKKPMGITVLKPNQLAPTLWELPIGEMFGVGAKSAERLQRLGIQTIGQLAHANARQLVRHFGRRGEEWIQLSNGVDERPVQEESEPSKSIGHSMTLGRDLAGLQELSTVLLNLSDMVGRRVRRHALVGRTVQITIRYANRRTITRSKTIPAATDLTEVIYDTAVDLLQAHWETGKPVRLLGVTLAQLSEPRSDDGPSDGQADPTEQHTGVQSTLFDLADEGATEIPNRTTTDASATVHRLSGRDAERLHRLARATDALRDKYGEDILVRGRMMTDPESGQIRNRRVRGTSLQKDWLRESGQESGPRTEPNDRNGSDTPSNRERKVDFDGKGGNLHGTDERRD